LLHKIFNSGTHKTSNRKTGKNKIFFLLQLSCVWFGNSQIKSAKVGSCYTKYYSGTTSISRQCVCVFSGEKLTRQYFYVSLSNFYFTSFFLTCKMYVYAGQILQFNFEADIFNRLSWNFVYHVQFGWQCMVNYVTLL
jgi:hypothetical protein